MTNVGVTEEDITRRRSLRRLISCGGNLCGATEGYRRPVSSSQLCWASVEDGEDCLVSLKETLAPSMAIALQPY